MVIGGIIGTDEFGNHVHKLGEWTKKGFVEKSLIELFPDKQKNIMEDNKFIQGYICALTCLIKSHGIATPICEAFRAGVGNTTLEQLKQQGVDEYDLEILKEHWKELNHRL